MDEYKFKILVFSRLMLFQIVHFANFGKRCLYRSGHYPGATYAIVLLRLLHNFQVPVVEHTVGPEI